MVMGADPVTQFAVEVEGEAAGGVGVFLQEDVSRFTAEIGYWLGEAHWGRGIMTAVVRRFTDYAFATWDLNRLYANVFAWNEASARVLESQPADEPFRARHDATSIFIYPPYRWRHTSALITNFHLPRSTLIALVAALVGLDEQRRLYQVAIDERYRFFRYGDAMFIE